MSSYGPDDRRGQLDEVPNDFVGEDEPGLFVAVTGVVDTRAKDRARICQRRHEPVKRNRPAVSKRITGALHPRFAVADQR